MVSGSCLRKRMSPPPCHDYFQHPAMLAGGIEDAEISMSSQFRRISGKGQKRWYFSFFSACRTTTSVAVRVKRTLRGPWVLISTRLTTTDPSGVTEEQPEK